MKAKILKRALTSQIRPEWARLLCLRRDLTHMGLGLHIALCTLTATIASGASWQPYPNNAVPSPSTRTARTQQGPADSALAASNSKSTSAADVRPSSSQGGNQPGDWPQWRGPSHNGVSREAGWTTAWPKEGPRQLWKASVGVGFSSMAVAQGRVFTLGNIAAKDTVFCFDAATGKELWSYAYPCPLDANDHEGGPAATPTVAGDHVFTFSKRGHVFCLDASSGKVVWQRNLLDEQGATKPDWGFAGSPVVEGDSLILNLGGAGTALATATGKTLWTSDTNVAAYATPVPFGAGSARGVAIFSGSGIVGVRVADGRELWRHPWAEEYKINAADPIFTTGDTFFVSSYSRGSALLRIGATGISEVWTNKNLAVGFNPCVLLNGHLFGVHGTADGTEKEVRCVDAATGQLKWKQEKFGLGSITAADGKLILLSERGELFVAEASTTAFKPLARAQVLGGKCWTTPVLANGRIYCRNVKGNLVCLDVGGSGGGDPAVLPVNAREHNPTANQTR